MINASYCVNVSSGTLRLHTALYSMGLAICVSILVLNTFVFFRIMFNERLRSMNNIILVNLSVADFGTGISFLIPTLIYLAIAISQHQRDEVKYKKILSLIKRNNQELFLIIYIPLVTSLVSQIVSLTALSFKKYIRISRPFEYNRLLSDHRIVFYLTIIAIWIVSILVCLASLLVLNDTHACFIYSNDKICPHLRLFGCMFKRIFKLDFIYIFTCISIICCFLIAFNYYRIYRCAQREYKAIARSNCMPNRSYPERIQILAPSLNPEPKEIVPLNILTEISSSSVPFIEEKLKCQADDLTADQFTTTSIYKNLMINKKALKSIIIIVVGFYVCWSPILTYFFFYACESRFDEMTVYFLMLIASCNSIINPIVHVITDKNILKNILNKN